MASHEILELLLVGAATVRVRGDGCERAEATTERVRRLATVLAAGGQADRLDMARSGRRRRPVLDARSMPVTRRQLLMLADTEPRALPEEHLSAQERLVAAVRALVPELAEEADQQPGPGAALQASGCTACGICVRACPENALRLEADAEPAAGSPAVSVTTVLSHVPARCAGTGACVRLCPEDALERTGSSAWTALLDDRPVELDRLATKTCARCKATIPADEGTLCELCEQRQRHPFRAALPPRLAEQLHPDTVARLTGGVS
ncbi:MAG: 4Fe-4S dicluster domain-containing protein [Nitriliruptoraceae bacterium]